MPDPVPQEHGVDPEIVFVQEALLRSPWCNSPTAAFGIANHAVAALRYAGLLSSPSLSREDDTEIENGHCPECGGRKLDRVEEKTELVRRRIERIVDSGSIYGLRARSSRPDRRGGGTGRRGVALACADCGWRVEGRAGDMDQDPEYQDVLRWLATGETGSG